MQLRVAVGLVGLTFFGVVGAAFHVTNVTSGGFTLVDDPPASATQMRCALLLFNPIDPNVLNSALALGGLSSGEFWELSNGTDFVIASWDVHSPFRNSVTVSGLVPNGLYLTRCGWRTQDGLGELAWTDKPVTFLMEPAVSLPQQQCHDAVMIQQSSWLWETWTVDQYPSLNVSKTFNFELQDSYSAHAPLGVHASDYDNCQQLKNAQFCTAAGTAGLSGYCVSDVCSTETAKMAFLSVASEKMAWILNTLLNTTLMEQGSLLVDPITALRALQPTITATGEALAIANLSTWDCGDNTSDFPSYIWLWAVPIISIIAVSLGLTVVDNHRIADIRESNEHLREHLMQSEQPTPTASKDWQSHGSFDALVKIFSLRRSWASLTSVRREQDGSMGSLNFIDGLRFFGATWVILGHTELLAESSYGIENSSTIFRGNGEMTKLWFQIVPGGFFAVDLFFWIGGFLGSYVMLRKLRKISASSFGAAVPLLAVSRWLRLVPSVLLVLGAFWMVQPHVGNGPFWIGQSAQSDACSKYWWAEVFFLTAWKDEWNSCIGVTWYLTCDFLFFCATPFVLLLDRKDRRLSVTVLMSLLTAGMVGCGTYSHAHGVKANEFLNQVDVERSAAWSHLYFRPYTRAGPYIVGILFALVCDHIDLRRVKQKLSPLKSMLLQLFGGLVCVFIVFIPYDEIRSVGCFPPQCAVADMKMNWSQTTSDLYNAVSRPLFAVGLSCVAAAIIFGRPVKGGGFVTWLLSMPFMSVLGKLSFHAYLWHFLFLRWYYTQQVSPFDYTWLNMLVWWLGFTYIAFAMATLSFLFVEAPFSELTTHCISKVERLTSRSKSMPQPPPAGESKA